MSDEEMAALNATWNAMLDPAVAEAIRRGEMWRALESDKGFDDACREWPKLDPWRGGPGYRSSTREERSAH